MAPASPRAPRSRHDYFWRLLCNILGEDVRRGRLPDDRKALGNLVANVCFYNARDYFGFALGRAAGEHARTDRSSGGRNRPH